MRVMIFTFFLLVGSAASAQVPAVQLLLVDSVENLVNSSLKTYLVKNDTGRIKTTSNKTGTGFYKKQFYIERKTGTLQLVTYVRRFDNGMLINETYYYSKNKPLSAYRLKQNKRKLMPEEAYYFYNDQTYKQNDSTILQRVNEIRSAAESFLRDYKKAK